MYVTRWHFSDEEVTSEIHSKQARYENELRDTFAIEEMFEKANSLTEPTYESNDEFFERFILLESNLKGTVRLGTAGDGSIHNIYISVDDTPQSLEDAESLARAIVSVGQDFGGSHIEVTDYTRPYRISVQMIANIGY